MLTNEVKRKTATGNILIAYGKKFGHTNEHQSDNNNTKQETQHTFMEVRNGKCQLKPW